MDDLRVANTAASNNLESHWMGFTWNRRFKADPMMVAKSKGMYYYTPEGREVLDAAAGLWCVNAGHTDDRIVEAIQSAAATLDYASTMNYGHPTVHHLANRLTDMAPEGFDHVFFCNSGSEAVDSALKIALAYHRVRGEGHRTRLIGRERGYHGVGFGGISVGGIYKNRMFWGPLINGTDHMRHTHDLEHQAFTKGQPEWGAHLADDLERMCALHDPSTIAAVIVEPVAGSTGVLVPPKGYLQRLRDICDQHGILLIFDEVITGFGRLGAPTAAEYFGVTPDIMCIAKGMTNGAVPMGGVLAKGDLYKAFMDWADETNQTTEFFHSYTYSGHPLAAAAGLATMDVYTEDGLFDRAAEMAPYFEQAIHGMKDAPYVKDIRNIGMMGAIELEPRPGADHHRAYETMRGCWDRGVMIRVTGDTIALTPPLIATKEHIDQILSTIREVLGVVG
ncbi:MAG: aspartate aminotransferase family protein [Alphaproteobacteria bacterium]